MFCRFLFSIIYTIIYLETKEIVYSEKFIFPKIYFLKWIFFKDIGGEKIFVYFRQFNSDFELVKPYQIELAAKTAVLHIRSCSIVSFMCRASSWQVIYVYFVFSVKLDSYEHWLFENGSIFFSRNVTYALFWPSR